MKSLLTVHDEEQALIKAAQHGDLNAFNALILRYQNLLYGIALRMLNDEDLASDAVQEALISSFSFRNSSTVHILSGFPAKPQPESSPMGWSFLFS